MTKYDTKDSSTKLKNMASNPTCSSGSPCSYLVMRKQKVVINGSSSDIKYLQDGVPQGLFWGCCYFSFI